LDEKREKQPGKQKSGRAGEDSVMKSMAVIAVRGTYEKESKAAYFTFLSSSSMDKSWLTISSPVSMESVIELDIVQYLKLVGAQSSSSQENLAEMRTRLEKGSNSG